MMDTSAATSLLRRAWVAQLHREHARICWAFKVTLAKPAIALHDTQRSWGVWDGPSRTIKISWRLISGYSWDLVVNILKHEMAHQLVQEHFRVDDGHGPLFQQACARLGLAPAFMRASGDLPPSAPGGADAAPATDRIMEKVRKLLSLAQSQNEHESLLAMKKVNELIAKYNIGQIGARDAGDYSYAIINPKRQRIELYQRLICTILSDYFFVEVICADLYDAASDQVHKVIELLGLAENVKIAEYVYYFLVQQLEILWRQYQKQSGVPRGGKRSYWLGVIQGFRERMAPEGGAAAAPAASSSALVVAEDKVLAVFIARRYPRLRRVQRRAAAVDQSCFQAGVDDGRQLTLHRGLTEADGNRGRLLGAGCALTK